MKEPGVLYHVTPASNHASIAALGVEPLYAKGKRKASWWVADSKLHWALAHTSAKLGISVNELEVWAVYRREIPHLKKFRYPGIYYTPCRVKPNYCHASHIFTGEPQ
jgi:hypothetical protein